MVEVYCTTIFLWGQGEKQLRSFVDIINKIHTTLKLAPELSKSSITFLDEALSIAEGIIKTDIRVKPIDNHHNGLSSSFYPFCSEREISTEKHLLERGYSESMLPREYFELELFPEILL